MKKLLLMIVDGKLRRRWEKSNIKQREENSREIIKKVLIKKSSSLVLVEKTNTKREELRKNY